MSEVLAIDIGGTKIATALVDDRGHVHVEGQAPTQAVVDGVPRTADELFGSLLEALAPLGSLPPGIRVGVSSAGPIELENETISPLNIPGWRRFPLIERLRAEFPGSRFTLLGDGHCVALGEAWLGAGFGIPSIIGCICSTGVGGGVVINNRPFQGSTGNAVHVGHAIVHVGGEPCACGARGCVEAYASGPSMVRRAATAGAVFPDAIALTAAAREGHETALRVIDEGMAALAAGLAGLVVNFDIPLVVVGGGVSKAGDIVWSPLARHFAEMTRLSFLKNTEIRRAELNNASLLGAARAALLTV